MLRVIRGEETNGSDLPRTRGFLPIQSDFALTGTELRLTALTLRLEDADAEKRRWREVLEDGTQEVHEGGAQRLLPIHRKVLHEVAVMLWIGEEWEGAPTSPFVILVVFLRGDEHLRTKVRKEARDLAVSRQTHIHLALLSLLYQVNNVQFAKGISESADGFDIAAVQQAEEARIQKIPHVIESLVVASTR